MLGQNALHRKNALPERTDGEGDEVHEVRVRALLRLATDRADRVVDEPNAEALVMKVVRPLFA